MELDRDIRTIFAYNLPLRATEKELFQFFSSAGQIGDVRIIVDRNTRKSKGFAYIEYANRVSIRFSCTACLGVPTASLPVFKPIWCRRVCISSLTVLVTFLCVMGERVGQHVTGGCLSVCSSVSFVKRGSGVFVPRYNDVVQTCVASF